MRDLIEYLNIYACQQYGSYIINLPALSRSSHVTNLHLAILIVYSLYSTHRIIPEVLTILFRVHNHLIA